MADLSAKGFIRRGNCLVPADYNAEDWLKSVPDGKEVLIDWRKPRHPENHRFLFSVLNLAVEHLDEHADVESLLDCLKIACGHVRPVVKADGEVIYLPKSINYSSMSEQDFVRFKNRALYVLSRILGFDATELLPEVDDRNRRANTGYDDRPEPPPSAYEEP